MSLLSAAEVEARMATGLDLDVLQLLIDDEQSWAENHPRLGLGPLTGERTQRCYRRPGDDGPLLLQRPTDEQGGLASGGRIYVQDGGKDLGESEVALTGPARIEKTSGAWRGPTIDVTYTPTDELIMRRGMFKLIRLALSDSPYKSEQSAGESYTRGADLEEQREDVLRSMHPHQPWSTQMVTGSGRITNLPLGWPDV
jgi:hypothetical protein